MALANYGANALVQEVSKIDAGNRTTEASLKSEYEATELAIAQYNRAVAVLQTDIAAGGPNVIADGTQLSQLQSQIAVSQLQANSEQAQYQAQYSPVESEESAIQIVGTSAYEGNDRLTFLEMGITGGIVGGAIIGAAVATIEDMKPRGLRKRPRTGR